MIKSSFQQGSSCQGVIYNVFQQPLLAASSGGLVVASVAAHPLAGTTHLTTLLAESLNSDADSCALTLDCRQLAEMTGSRFMVPESYSSRQERASALPVSALTSGSGSWRGSRDFRAAYLAELRERFGYVLIDCPSLKESTDVLGLAPLVDGVLLVIEANRTTKNQITYLERTIVNAGGKILGHILNKRTYPIPHWAYRKMEAWGL